MKGTGERKDGDWERRRRDGMGEEGGVVEDRGGGEKGRREKKVGKKERDEDW